MIVVTPATEMDAGSNRNAILITRGTDGGPVVRPRYNRIRRSNRTLDGIGRVGARDADIGFGLGLGVGFGLGLGVRSRRGIRRSLLLKFVELLLHQAQLLLQRGNLGVRAGGLRACLR